MPCHIWSTLHDKYFQWDNETLDSTSSLPALLLEQNRMEILIHLKNYLALINLNRVSSIPPAIIRDVRFLDKFSNSSGKLKSFIGFLLFSVLLHYVRASHIVVVFAYRTL